jgi:hypothetical protein
MLKVCISYDTGGNRRGGDEEGPAADHSVCDRD